MDEKDLMIVQELSQKDFKAYNLLVQVFNRLDNRMKFHEFYRNFSEKRQERGRPLFRVYKNQHRKDLNSFISAFVESV